MQQARNGDQSQVNSLQLQHHIFGSVATIESIPVKEVFGIGLMMRAALDHGGRILTLGCGGSAAHASHLAAEITGRYLHKTRPRWDALCLNSDGAVLTALANDYSFINVFSAQVEAHGRNAFVVAFSTSGTSPSVLRALDTAVDLECDRILITGANYDGPHPSIKVLSDKTPHIQEAHQVIIHMLCEILEAES